MLTDSLLRLLRSTIKFSLDLVLKDRTITSTNHSEVLNMVTRLGSSSAARSTFERGNSVIRYQENFASR